LFFKVSEPVLREAAGLVRTLASEVLNETRAIQQQQVKIRVKLDDIKEQNEEILNVTKINEALVKRDQGSNPASSAPTCSPPSHEPRSERWMDGSDSDDSEEVLSAHSIKIVFIALLVHFIDYVISAYWAPRLGIKRHILTKALLC
jgi:hypothetical protein